MNGKKTAERFYDSNVVIEKIIWLAGISTLFQGDQFEEFVQDHSPDEMADIFELPNAKQLIELDNDGEFGSEAVLDVLYRFGKFGFLAEVVIPVKKFRKDGESYSFSYGSRYCPIYAETIEELIEKAIKESKEFEESDRKKGVA
jgi:hypothetical protein